MTNKTLSQIFDETIEQETNDFIIMFNALLYAEAQIIQNQMIMIGCLEELVKDDNAYLDLLHKTIDKNDELVKSIFKVIRQNNETD